MSLKSLSGVFGNNNSQGGFMRRRRQVDATGKGSEAFYTSCMKNKIHR